MIKSSSLILFFGLFFGTFTSIFSQNQYVSLSIQLIEAARYDKDYAPLLEKLANINQENLATSLATDIEKKAFWINIYNAHIQCFLNEDPSLYDDRGAFFSTASVVVAGKKLSFDDIEHGIIRRSKNKFSLGFLPSFFVDDYEKKFRTKKADGRVHFALNCGAKSCPAVAAYDDRYLENQLDESTRIHLQKTSKYDAVNEVVNVTSLFSWFRADFGSKKKIRQLLQKHEIIPKGAKPSLNYNTYDWTILLDNYIDLKVQ
ncbi:MAG: DUF547 domain-containing protein [Chitinophagales bacterium]